MVFQKENPQEAHSLAGELQGGLDGAAALPKRLARYDKAHRRTLVMSHYAKCEGNHKIARVLQQCGGWLRFRDYYTVDKLRLSGAYFCRKHLLCPFCAIRRAGKAMKAYLDRLTVIRDEHPSAKLYLVTFTIKNGEDLGERYRHLTSSMRRYQQARRDHLSNPVKNKHVEMAKALGCVGSYEFKRGSRQGLWHPHVHMIWLCNEKPDQQKIRDDWERITGDSFMCDVRELRNQDEPSADFCEVFKYALKFSDMSMADNWHGFETLSSRRMIFSFGAFYGVKVPDELTDDCFDELPYVELLYRHSKAGYTLVKTKTAGAPSAHSTDGQRLAAGGGEDAPTRSDSEDCRHPRPERLRPAQRHEFIESMFEVGNESDQRQQNGGIARYRAASSPPWTKTGRLKSYDRRRTRQAIPRPQESQGASF